MNQQIKIVGIMLLCLSLVGCSIRQTRPSKEEKENIEYVKENIGNGKTYAMGDDYYYDSKGIVKYKMIKGFSQTEENDTFMDKKGNVIKVDVDYIRDVEDIFNVNDLKHIYFEYDYKGENYIDTVKTVNGDFILMKTEKGYDLITKRILRIPAGVPDLVLGVVIKLELVEPTDSVDMLLEINRFLKSVS